MEKPIQKAIPKNWLGTRWVAALVAKKTPMTGRVVAIPRRMAIGAQQPAALEGGFAALTVAKGAQQGVKEQRVEEKDGGTLDPAADRISAHRIGRESDHRPERKEDALGPLEVSEARENGERGEKNEKQGGNDVGEGEGRVGGESVVQAGHLRRAVVRWEPQERTGAVEPRPRR